MGIRLYSDDKPIAADTKDDQQHMLVLVEAFTVFKEKSALRSDMWRQFPPSDKIRELRERIYRIETARNAHNATMGTYSRITARQAIREDAIDIINYATFLIKQIDEGAQEL